MAYTYFTSTNANAHAPTPAFQYAVGKLYMLICGAVMQCVGLGEFGGADLLRVGGADRCETIVFSSEHYSFGALGNVCFRGNYTSRPSGYRELQIVREIVP